MTSPNNPYAKTAYEPFVIQLANKKKNQVTGQYDTVIRDYMPVDGRVREAVDVSIAANIGMMTTTQILRDDDKTLVVCVTVETPRGRTQGISAVSKGAKGGAEQSNPYEVAETSALGRALGFQGYGIIPGSGIASADDMQRVPTEQKQSKPTVYDWSKRPGTLVADIDAQVGYLTGNRNTILLWLAQLTTRGTIKPDTDEKEIITAMQAVAKKAADKKVAAK